MPDSIHFQLVYEGPSLESNEMDVRELAPALVAVADLLEEANRIVNGDAARVQVNVRGSFRTGSFGIDFSLLYTIYQQLLTVLNSDTLNAANNLISLVGLKELGKGLIAKTGVWRTR